MKCRVCVVAHVQIRKGEGGMSGRVGSGLVCVRVLGGGVQQIAACAGTPVAANRACRASASVESHVSSTRAGPISLARP